MGRSLPIPPNFAANVRRRNDELTALYGVHSATISRWRTRLNMRIHDKRRRLDLPADWYDFAPGKKIGALKARYGVSQKTITRWRGETGVSGYKPERQERAARSRKRIMPEDFAAVAPTLLVKDLCARYACKPTVIHRWCGEAGVKPRPYRNAGPAPKPKPRVTPIRGRFVLPGAMPGAALPGPKAGREEEAAQYLRRFAAVYRCGPRGGADPRGKQWRYGTAVLSPAELEARARRHGWDPDEWRVVAGQSIRRDALPSFPRAGAM